MHLARRSYAFVMLIAIIAVGGIWSSEPLTAALWRIPAGLLLLGLAIEGYATRRLLPGVRVETAARAYLGREQPAAFVFSNDSTRPLALEYAQATPPGLEAPGVVRRVTLAAHGALADPLLLLPVRLGPQHWPPLPARLRGPLGLAWWSIGLQPVAACSVAPDLTREVSLRGLLTGTRPRRASGAGQELYQLRAYERGDPLSRIDWKASARSGGLITRSFSEDQNLDVLVAIDAGRLSRVRAGRLDRLGLYCNIAARFAERVTANDDRIGLAVYAERVLASCAPARGLAAVASVRRTLEGLDIQPAESAAMAAAVAIRNLLRQRALVVVLTDLDDANNADALARAVRLLAPPHIVLLAGVQSGEINALAASEATQWQEPWIALAAREHLSRAQRQRALLERLGAPVVAAAAQRLEQALAQRYEALRRSRRI
jgi:uncharacterized protein (DUF58 family)